MPMNRPIDIDLPLPYDTEEVSWEITASYRFWNNLHVQGGYVDLGNFHSEPLFVATPAIVGVVPPPVFGTRPGEAIVINPDPFPLQPATLTASRVSLDAHAWLLGLKVDHDMTGRVKVYARAAALRAEFDTRSDFGPSFEIHDPSDRTGWAWGIGAHYQIFPRVAVGAAYSQYDVKLHKLDSYQLTLAFRLL
jgi:opacity protein-like surface antigen